MGYVDFSRGAWNNARWMTGKVLEWAGLASMPGRYQVTFTLDHATCHCRLEQLAQEVAVAESDHGGSSRR